VVPIQKDGVNTALAAHVVCAPGVEGDRKLTKQLKAALKERLPEYMCPRTFTYHDELPSNVNGKIDRKALQAQVARKGGAAR
jgi:acyl-coenzyme A synthetase/AMP-(fatty) acid ligase